MHFIMNFNFNFKLLCKVKQTKQSAVNGDKGRGEWNNEAITPVMRRRAISLLVVCSLLARIPVIRLR